MSCGDNSITSGFGFDDLDLCSRELAGDYRGLATSDSGNPSGTILVTLRQDECTVRGSVTFPPCLPVTGVTGSAGFSSNFPVALQTVTSSPSLRFEDVRDPNAPPEVVFPPSVIRYTLTTDGGGGCPATDTGTVMFSKT